MTREEIKKALPAFKAYADGKIIQLRKKGAVKWVDFLEDDIVVSQYYEYRIKPEPKYRPFKSEEECWEEMLKHQPFGWIKSKITKQIYCIGVVAEEEMYCFNEFWNYQDAFEQFTFIDGTPFGI